VADHVSRSPPFSGYDDYGRLHTVRTRSARSNMLVAVASFAMLSLPAPVSPAAFAEEPVTISITCVDWFLSGGHRDHIHIEFHVKDERGHGVPGAQVTFDASYDRMDGSEPFVYLQDTTTSTTKKVGRNKGRGCAPGTASPTTTGWFCCIGAGKWDGEIPGKRACPPGFYHAVVTSVVPPEGSDMVWDGISPPNGVEFTPDHD
jgi:hypothetical protein